MFSFFHCKACKAREDEIDHLRVIIDEQQKALEKAQSRVMELAEPGVNRRLRVVETGERPDPGPRYTARPQYPGYELRPEPQFVVDESES